MPNIMLERAGSVKPFFRAPRDYFRRRPVIVYVPTPVDLRPTTRYAPRPKWGVDQVTVCIAAICESGSKIVLVSDRMLSTVSTSTEIGLKVRKLHQDWYAMFSGDDISQVEMVQGAANLAKKESVTALDAVHAMRAAYQTVRRQQIQDNFLSTFKWDVDKFLSQGKNKIPAAEYSNLWYKIETFDLGCQFLVAGFSRKPTSSRPSAVIFEVVNPGVVRPCTAVGWGVIGSGYPNAWAHLARRKQASYLSLARTLYYSISAKRLAESALGVGRETSVFIMSPDGEHTWVGDSKVRKICQMWDEEESEIVPADLDERIPEILDSEAK
jgi:hypothetical protein